MLIHVTAITENGDHESEREQRRMYMRLWRETIKGWMLYYNLKNKRDKIRGQFSDKQNYFWNV